MTEENQKNNRETAKDLLEKAEKGERFDFSSGEKKDVQENKLSEEYQILKEEIRRELQIMEQDENLKKESENKAKQIQTLGEEEKLKHLLQIAKSRGVAYAVKVANDMKDPYILDTFHDMLVREGLWRRFEK